MSYENEETLDFAVPSDQVSEISFDSQSPFEKQSEAEAAPKKEKRDKKKEPVVKEIKVTPAVDYNQELIFAQEQIERCLDYTEVQGADFKGRFRGSLKEWRKYKYAVRRAMITQGPLPARPSVAPDY